LAEANPHLYALIVAALTTGCRKRELLSMRWSQVREGPKPEIRLSASNTKTDKPRAVPLTPRLKAVLAMRRTGPDGEPNGPDTFVFGKADPTREVCERSLRLAFTC
jgi:integrase